MVLPVPRGAWTFICLPVLAGFDGAEDLDVEVLEFEHAVADVFDVVIDEEVGTDIAGVGFEFTKGGIILLLLCRLQPFSGSA